MFIFLKKIFFSFCYLACVCMFVCVYLHVGVGVFFVFTFLFSSRRGVFCGFFFLKEIIQNKLKFAKLHFLVFRVQKKNKTRAHGFSFPTLFKWKSSFFSFFFLPVSDNGLCSLDKAFKAILLSLVATLINLLKVCSF